MMSCFLIDRNETKYAKQSKMTTRDTIQNVFLKVNFSSCTLTIHSHLHLQVNVKYELVTQDYGIIMFRPSTTSPMKMNFTVFSEEKKNAWQITSSLLVSQYI